MEYSSQLNTFTHFLLTYSLKFLLTWVSKIILQVDHYSIFINKTQLSFIKRPINLKNSYIHLKPFKLISNKKSSDFETHAQLWLMLEGPIPWTYYC